MEKELEEAIDKMLLIFESQLEGLVSDTSKNGTEYHKNKLREILQNSISKIGCRFKVLEFIQNQVVDDVSFISEMTKCCGKTYNFQPVSDLPNFYESFDDKDVSGWQFHISWLVEPDKQYVGIDKGSDDGDKQV